MFTKNKTKCPYCKEVIKIDAIKCKHCGEWIKGKTEKEETEKNANINSENESKPENSKIEEKANNLEYPLNDIKEVLNNSSIQKNVTTTNTIDTKQKSIEIEGEILDTERLELIAKTNYKKFIEITNNIKNKDEGYYNNEVFPLIQKYEIRKANFNKTAGEGQYSKYGWGWFILAGMFYQGLAKGGIIGASNRYGILLFLIALIPLLLIYFYIRKKILVRRFDKNGNYGKVYSASFNAGLLSLVPVHIITVIIFVLISYNMESKDIQEVTIRKNVFYHRLEELKKEKGALIEEFNKEIDYNNMNTGNKIYKTVIIEKAIEVEKNIANVIDSFEVYINNSEYFKKQKTDLTNYNKFIKNAKRLCVSGINGLESLKYYYKTKDERYYDQYVLYMESAQKYLKDFNSDMKEIFKE